ncbi:Endonuclease/exonuclease/phosphatase [Dichotomocladium elegans]|nr:Endonuclease/exonuclease/phosphatase [Dichotomocladium elegans]
MNNSELSVLTLNCWGLWLVSKKREFRLRAIADAISAQDAYDIVTLQELWVQKDFEYLKQQTRGTLPYAKYFYSGAMGSGLAILSRFPIVATNYTQYTLAGRPLKIFHGDFYVGKGFALASVEHPDIGIVDVFTTHLHAGYGADDTEYEGHRLSESWELAHSVRASAAQGRQVILTGDFNSLPTSQNHHLLERHALMTDAWHQANKNKVGANDDHTDEQRMIQAGGITCNSPLNSWAAKKKSSNSTAAYLGDRLDYIFYKSTPVLQCLRSSVVMTERISGTALSYSDHFGVHAVFGIDLTCPLDTEAAEGGTPLREGRDRYNDGRQDLSNPTYTNLTPDALEAIKAVFVRDQAATRQTANVLLACFVFSIILILSLYTCLVAVASDAVADNDHPTGSRLVPLLVALFSGLAIIVAAVLGTICLIVGFVFGRNEQRALAQFVGDVDTLLRAIRSRTPFSATAPRR